MNSLDALELKRYLERERNIKPDFIEGHGHNSFSLIYLIRPGERLYSANPAESIRETIKDQCADIMRITRCSERKFGTVRCNVVLTDPRIIEE